MAVSLTRKIKTVEINGTEVPLDLPAAQNVQTSKVVTLGSGTTTITPDAGYDAMSQVVATVNGGGSLEWINASFQSVYNTTGSASLIIDCQSGYTSADYDLVAVRVFCPPTAASSINYAFALVDVFADVGDTMGGSSGSFIMYENYSGSNMGINGGNVNSDYLNYVFNANRITISIVTYGGTNMTLVKFDPSNSYQCAVLVKHK